jgi:hypothetical protein
MAKIGELISAIKEALGPAEELEHSIEHIADDSGYDEDARTAAIEAINQIRRGATDDAVTTLERHFLPKWGDADDARRAYNATMGVM